MRYGVKAAPSHINTGMHTQLIGHLASFDKRRQNKALDPTSVSSPKSSLLAAASTWLALYDYDATVPVIESPAMNASPSMATLHSSNTIQAVAETASEVSIPVIPSETETAKWTLTHALSVLKQLLDVSRHTLSRAGAVSACTTLLTHAINRKDHVLVLWCLRVLSAVSRPAQVCAATHDKDATPPAVADDVLVHKAALRMHEKMCSAFGLHSEAYKARRALSSIFLRQTGLLNRPATLAALGKNSDNWAAIDSRHGTVLVNLLQHEARQPVLLAVPCFRHRCQLAHVLIRMTARPATGIVLAQCTSLYFKALEDLLQVRCMRCR